MRAAVFAPGAAIEADVSVIVCNRKSRLYFQALSRWTDDPKTAYVFQTSEAALSFCEYHGLRDVLVVRPVSGARGALRRSSKSKRPHLRA